MSPVDDVHSDFRGTGRTTRMLAEIDHKLPSTVVVVHHESMVDHCKMLIHKQYPELAAIPYVKFVVIRGMYDTDRLRGLTGPVLVDHAVWTHVNEEACDWLRVFLRNRERRV